jgi:hypothetical protein
MQRNYKTHGVGLLWIEVNFLYSEDNNDFIHCFHIALIRTQSALVYMY